MFFYIISIVVFCTIIYFMPKRLTKLEMYATSWFALTFVLAVDTYLSEIHNFYGYFTGDKTGWKTLIITLGIYPTYNAIFLNFLPKKRIQQVWYILGHSLVLITYEWITIKVGAFHYNDWKLIYSVLLYPFILLILYLNLVLLQFLKDKEHEEK